MWSSLVATARGALWLSEDGEIERLSGADAARRAVAASPLVVHAPATAARLGLDGLAARDLLELYAFVRPASFCLPTPRGLAEATDVDPSDELAALPKIAKTLLDELEDMAALASPEMRDTATAMARGNWSWSGEVLKALGLDHTAKKPRPGAGLDIWKSLPVWEEPPPATPPGSLPIEPREARLRLAQLVSSGPNLPEVRPTQSDYASAASEAFAPREEEDKPKVVLVEAGTGVGKTLGYVAPASLWAEKNGAPVWIATYTRNLQRQIDNELDRLHRDSAEKRRRVVIRKGRENYLCLLNFQEAVMRTGLVPENAVGLGLLARWALASRDGDMIGGDLPAWLLDLLGRGRIGRLADRRGECIYSACEHYRKCFVERTIRRARTADIVIANHALVMVQAAMGGLDDATRPTRYVFDEGHHLFDAADGAFGAHLSGVECSDLRRWILGAEGRRGSRARGLERRVSDLLGEDEEAHNALRRLLDLSRRLPSPNWQTRLADGTVMGPAEEFLALVRVQVRARAAGEDQGFGRECDIRPLNPGLIEAADQLAQLFEQMVLPVRRLKTALKAKLEGDADKLDSGQRGRIEGVMRSLTNRCEVTLEAWRAMLRGLHNDADPAFVDWFAIERSQNREHDVGMFRHYLDPTEPFVNSVIKPAHGAVITSATLRDSLGVPYAANDDPEPSSSSGTPAVRRDNSRQLVRRRSPYRHPPPPRPRDARVDGLAIRLRQRHPRADREGRPARRHRPGGRGLPRAVPRIRRWRPRPVHGDRPLARRAPAHRPGARGGEPPALRPACRRHGRSDPGRHLPRRGALLPARHRRGARRRRRTRPLAATHRVRPRALATPRHPPPRAKGGVESRRRGRQRLRRHAGAASPQAGLRPADPAGRRSWGVRDAGLAAAVAAAECVSRGSIGGADGSRRGPGAGADVRNGRRNQYLDGTTD